MRREFTGISMLSMLVAGMAGIVLCMQLAYLKPSLGLEISGRLLWVVEVGVFGTAVYLWQREISLEGWALGISGLVLVQMMLTVLAGMAFRAAYGEGDGVAGLQAMSAEAPRVCSVFFSLLVCYPLHVFLPRRRARVSAGTRRYANSPAAQPTVPAAGDSVWSLVIPPGNDSARASAPEAALGAPSSARSFVLADQSQGVIELSVRAVLGHVPQDLLANPAHEIKDSQTVPIPLGVILPQLREAQILASLAQIRSWLPTGARKLLVETFHLDEEQEVVKLPLDLIVAQLPPRTLALPPPSPPAWARADEIAEIAFAAV